MSQFYTHFALEFSKKSVEVLRGESVNITIFNILLRTFLIFCKASARTVLNTRPPPNHESIYQNLYVYFLQPVKAANALQRGLAGPAPGEKVLRDDAVADARYEGPVQQA